MIVSPEPEAEVQTTVRDDIFFDIEDPLFNKLGFELMGLTKTDNPDLIKSAQFFASFDAAGMCTIYLKSFGPATFW